VVLTGFVAKTAGFPRSGNAFKASGEALCFHQETPALRSGFGGASLALGLPIALLSVPLAFARMPLQPYRTPLAHPKLTSVII